MNPDRILIVEDDRTLLRVLKDNFEFSGYEVLVAEDGEQGLQAALNSDPDLLVLDVMLPGIDGLRICHELRRSGSALPILMLTARAEESDVVNGFDLGADDYMTKPFRVSELLARVRAMLRRGRREQQRVISFGEFTLDRTSHRLLRGEAEVPLPPKEFALLQLLASEPGRAFSRQAILDAVWGRKVIVTPRSVDRCVKGLRSKIEADPREPRWIHTVRDHGYRFEVDEG